VKIAQTDLRSEKEAKKVAEQLTKKLPKSRQAEEGGGGTEKELKLDE